MRGYFVGCFWTLRNGSYGPDYRASSTYSDPNRASRQAGRLEKREQKWRRPHDRAVCDFRIVPCEVESCQGDLISEDVEIARMKANYDEEVGLAKQP